MTTKSKNIKGLTTSEAKNRQVMYGKNELTPEKKESFLKKIFLIICEPMFLLLIVAATIYFILGEPRDGAIMLIFVVGIISIDVIQEWKTDKTLNALKDLSAPQINVIRDDKEITIASSDLVPGDLMLIYEGIKIPADGVIVKCSDLCVDESSLTGEAEGVWKNVSDDSEDSKDYWRKDYCYAGTLVTQGSATILVDKIGTQTEYGKIGENIAKAPETKTPLQKQTDNIVKVAATIAGILFVLVCIITYFNLSNLSWEERIIESILSGITLAMAMIPEEFPVILTVFLSMGAWRLAKKQSLVRKLPSVETLGAVSVLCVDKTGTITMNQMTVDKTWSLNKKDNQLIETMGLACETDAYDPMEKAMLDYCDLHGYKQKDLFSGKLLTEYPFTNELKMMGHVWQRNNQITIAAKGSPEKILTICDIDEKEKEEIENQILKMSKEGLRVIAVAVDHLESQDEIPKELTDCKLIFLGLIGLVDPPRESVKNDISVCNNASIRVVMITGDNGMTASAIAKKVGIQHSDEIITGDMLNSMSDEELCEKVKTVNIFSRVVPEHKMRIVNAFQKNGEIVAMTGDGVNDAPALKHADIGIAMGKRGSEVSREAADLILLDDNFTTIVETVKDGRRIYDNIRKAVGYVFTIHMPIAFASLLAPLLGISSNALLLLPLHVVLLELIIDPTCSIVFERQPADEEIMERQPRDPQENILNKHILTKSIIQGIVLFIASFTTYYIVLDNNIVNAPIARSMGLAIIMIANLILVQVNSSETHYAYHSISRLAKDKIMWFANLGTIAMLLIILYSPLNTFLKLAPLSRQQFLLTILIGVVSVIWYELVKLFNNIKAK